MTHVSSTFLVAATALLSLAPAAARAAYVPEALILAANSMDGERVRIMDPVRNRIVYDYDLDKQSLEECNLQKVFCGPIGAKHTLIDGEDYLDVAMYVNDRRRGASPLELLHSVIVRVRPTTPPQLVWEVKELDFSDIPQMAEMCARDPDAPFGDTDPHCGIQMVHTLEVVDDQPDQNQVTVVLADLIGQKVLQVTLDYTGGNTVGHVDWILNALNPEWPSFNEPNSAQLIPDEPGGPYLLVTYYSEVAQPYGAGGIVMWQWNGTGWQRAWAFPDDAAGELPYLNTPHMAKYMVDPRTGTGGIYYNHSRGLAGDWGSYTAYGGSFGLLTPGATLADPPDYRFDAVLYRGDARQQSHFSRDMDFLDDGTLLLTDAGCEESLLCKYPSRIFRVKPFQDNPGATTRPGAYRSDLSGLNLRDIPPESVIQEYQCGFWILFEAEWMTTAHLGATLLQAADQARTPCPPPGTGQGVGLRHAQQKRNGTHRVRG